MENPSTNHYSISAVETALELLEVFGEVEGELCITRLAERLGTTKSRIFRLMATFEQKGYVEKSKLHGKYGIGISAYETSRKLLSRMALLNKSKPVMEKLARECAESIYLAVPVGDDILFLEMVSTSQKIQAIPLVGKRYPLKKVAPGAVVFAYSKLGKALFGEWAVTREQGYLIDHDKLAAGLTSVALPLFSQHNEVIGSLCLIGPSFRLSEEEIKKTHISRLQFAASLVSAQLGYLDKDIKIGWSDRTS